MPEDDENIMVGLSLIKRELGPEPTAMLDVPLGGPDPVIVISVGMDTPNLIDLHMQVSGFPSDQMVIDLLRTIAEHMETQPSSCISDDGVEVRGPLKEADGT